VVGVVVGVAGRADAQVPDALHEVVGVDRRDVAGATGLEHRVEERPADRHEAIDEVGVQRIGKIRALEAGTLMEAMNMLAWDSPIWAFRPFLVGWSRYKDSVGPSHD